MRRLLSGVGRTLITAGVLLLLFVVYQLWGTNIQQAQKQRKLKTGFESELAAAGITPIEFGDFAPTTLVVNTTPTATDVSATTVAATGERTPPATTATPATAGTTTPTTAGTTTPATAGTTTPATAGIPTPTTAGTTTPTLPSVRAGRTAMKAPRPGRALGLLVIPRIKQRQVIVEGTAKTDLEGGPGRYLRSAYPGQPGNAAIAGHRTTFGAPFFNLALMRPGDPIFIQTKQGNFRYDVIDACRPKCTGSGSFIVSPNDRTVLAPTPDDNVLTLTTCHPKYSARQRLIVRARLVGPAADADFFAPPEPPPTTAPPVTTVPPTSPPITPDDPLIDPDASSVPPVETAVSGVPVTDVTADPPTPEAQGPSLSSRRDPGGSGPVWTLGMLTGHRSTWTETGLLVALCALIWLGFWRLARPRRLLAQAVIYTGGFVLVFLPALYFTFEVLSRLLPENL